MNLRSRLARLEKEVAQRGLCRPPPEPDAALIDDQLAATLERFLNGESLEAIARSQGRPWAPPVRDALGYQPVGEDDLREGIRGLLDATPAEAPSGTRPSDERLSDIGLGTDLCDWG
jgi:hypothetical protein